MRSRWREPVIVLHLDEDFGLGFDVPGHRPDGTVKGKNLIRRFSFDISRGIEFAVAYVLYLSSSAGTGSSGKASFTRQIHVKGPADALALGPVDVFRSASGAWLVRSPSSLAIVDTGSTLIDPANARPPQIL